MEMRMTGEMHTLIIMAGMQALLELTPEQLRAYEPWLKRKHVLWVLANPELKNPDNERAMEIIRRAAKLLEEKDEEH